MAHGFNPWLDAPGGFLWGLQQGRRSWWEQEIEEESHLVAARKQKEKKRRGQGSNVPFKGTPPYDWKISN